MPPDGVTVAVPFVAPLQLMAWPLYELVMAPTAPNTAGCVMVTETLRVHPRASVTVAVYVFGAKLEAVRPVCPLDQSTEYGAVPPVGATVAVPLAKPLHDTGVLLLTVTANGAGSVTVNVCVAEQLMHSIKEILSNPKSLPEAVVFWFTIQMLAVVFAPEFHTAKNWFHWFKLAGA